MIGVGVIGYGYWGPLLARHLGEQGARVVTVADPDATRRAEARRRLPGARVRSEAAALIRDPLVDAVVVATPVATHAAMVHSALEAGKAVWVEKPLATTPGDAARLVEAAARRRLTLFVDHTFVYAPAAAAVREIVRKGDLGDLYYYDAVRINLGRFQPDVNVLWDLAVHDLALLDDLAGTSPSRVSATGVAHLDGEPENLAYVTAFYPGRFVAHLHVNWLAPVKVRRVLLGGSRRMVLWDDLEPAERVRVYDRGVDPAPAASLPALRVGYRTGDLWAPRLDEAEPLALAAAHFLECVATGLRPRTDGEAGWRVVQVLEAASRSLARHGEPVAVPGA